MSWNAQVAAADFGKGLHDYQTIKLQQIIYNQGNYYCNVFYTPIWRDVNIYKVVDIAIVAKDDYPVSWLEIGLKHTIKNSCARSASCVEFLGF